MKRFLGDAMLGQLCTYLRMCGYDTAYALDRDVVDPAAIREWADAEERTLVTRNASLAARTADAIRVEAHEPIAQLAELRDAGVELSLPAEPRRCSRCNGVLDAVAPTEPRPDYAPQPGAQPVWRCPDCGQCFWRGSHWDDFRERLPD